MIGIIAAMDIELAALLGDLSEPKSEQIGAFTFHTGSIAGRAAVLCKCGIGKVFAALCAQTMCLSFDLDCIINTGVAGGLADGLCVLDVVVADSVVQHDMDTSAIGDPVGLISGINMIWLPTSERAVAILKDAAESIGVPATKQTLLLTPPTTNPDIAPDMYPSAAPFRAA